MRARHDKLASRVLLVTIGWLLAIGLIIWGGIYGAWCAARTTWAEAQEIWRHGCKKSERWP